MRRLIADLPPEVQETLSRHETSGTADSSEYKDAVRTFFRRHGGGRIQPRPDCLNRLANKPGDEVYDIIMWGPSEWFVTGTLKDWDIADRLPEIRVPTLIVGAQFDHATPALAEKMHRGVRGSETDRLFQSRERATNRLQPTRLTPTVRQSFGLLLSISILHAESLKEW